MNKMKFEWDDDKNEANIEKHGLSFEQAVQIFEGFTLRRVDDRYDYGERRDISIGMIDGEAVIVVVHTDRQGRCRIISARPAKLKERQRYEQALQKAFDA